MKKSLIKYAKMVKHSALLTRALIEDGRMYAKNSDILGHHEINNLEASILAGSHGIDKGLTIPQWNKKDSFGKDKVRKIIGSCRKLARLDSDSFALKVAACTLTDYMNDPSADPAAKEEAARYLKESGTAVAAEVASVTVPKEDYESWAQREMDGFFLNRTSIRYFDAAPPPEELVFKSVRLACKTPSACNRQGWKVFYFEGRKDIDKALSHQTGSADFRGQVPALFLVCGDQTAYRETNERHQARIDASMLAMSLIYTLRSNGLSSVPLNCSLSIENMRKMRSALNIEDKYVPVMFIAFGYPLETNFTPLSPRKPLEQVLEKRSYGEPS